MRCHSRTTPSFDKNDSHYRGPVRNRHAHLLMSSCMDVDGHAGLIAATDLLRALASEHRLAIVQELSTGPTCVHELVDALGVSQSLVSQHLRVLRGARVVRSERRGREVAYSLSDDHIAHIVADAVTHAAESNRSH